MEAAVHAVFTTPRRRPMEPGSYVFYRVAHRPIRGTNRHGLVVLLSMLFLATALRAQPAAASMTNTPQPFCCGPAIFDAAGNLYYFSSYSGPGPGAPPITAGAAQTAARLGRPGPSSRVSIGWAPCY